LTRKIELIRYKALTFATAYDVIELSLQFIVIIILFHKDLQHPSQWQHTDLLEIEDCFAPSAHLDTY
jgi:hypothetical protein